MDHDRAVAPLAVWSGAGSAPEGGLRRCVTYAALTFTYRFK
jgi:hypothetical protein